MSDSSHTTIIRTDEELDGLAAVIARGVGPIGFDTETSGPSIVWRKKSRANPYKAELTGFSVAYGPNWEYRFYIPVDHAEGGNVSEAAAHEFLQALMDLARRGHRVWAHNWKYDLQVLRNFGVDYGDSSELLNDSMVAAWLAGWGSGHKKLALKPLAEARGMGASDTFEQMAKKRQARDIPVEEIAPYAGGDAYKAGVLGEEAYAELLRDGLVEHFHTLDMPLVEITRAMEGWGAALDRESLLALKVRLREEADNLAKEFFDLTTVEIMLPVKEKVAVGFFKNGNPKFKTELVMRPLVSGADVKNDRQVARWCYEELRIWPTSIRRTKGGKLEKLVKNGADHFPVDHETVSQWLTLDSTVGKRAATIRLEYAKREKLLSTYLEPMLRLPEMWGDDLLHCSFHLTGTDTQRFSSSGPNLQNVPSRTEEGKAIRAALRARPGKKMVVLDYSQIELRVVAHLSQDPNMLAAYLFDEDIHAQTLAALRELRPDAIRADAKITNFSTIYRISPMSLAVKMATSVRNAELSIEAFYKQYPGIAKFHGKAIRYALKHGYCRTIDGFRRKIDTTPTKWDDIKWSEGNKAINTPVQGSAGGIVKKAMIDAWRTWKAAGVYGVRVNFVCQEHDSLIVEADEDYAEQAERELRFAMENAVKLRVPIKADGGIGDSWSEAKG